MEKDASGARNVNAYAILGATTTFELDIGVVRTRGINSGGSYGGCAGTKFRRFCRQNFPSGGVQHHDVAARVLIADIDAKNTCGVNGQLVVVSDAVDTVSLISFILRINYNNTASAQGAALIKMGRANPTRLVRNTAI